MEDNQAELISEEIARAGRNVFKGLANLGNSVVTASCILSAVTLACAFIV